ncbi:MAG: hypothetical protein CVT49_04965 [candidate division Zixibacteria bacterium HGW-Zixibacteria-1]|nr:MAG: hypothetical protein CVT49_04965 [candidate division Zixibacteria bacterium HGW-Zixibacteria-1]
MSVKKVIIQNIFGLLTIFLLMISTIHSSDEINDQGMPTDIENLQEGAATDKMESSPEVTPIQAIFLSPGDTISWQVIGSGATSGISEQYLLNGTVGQSAIGFDSAAVYLVRSGFWQFFCDCRPGDADASGSINILDVSFLINYLYKGGSAPRPYALCSGDADCNCMINILDVTQLINYLYKNGNPPCECEDWVLGCGQPLRK